MSELSKEQSQKFRRDLLVSVSMLALLGNFEVSQSVLAAPAGDDTPTIWVELGGQFEQATSSSQIFAPPFFKNTPEADLAPMIAAQKPPGFSIGGEGKITFQPRHTDWVFSAAVRYGRSDSAKHKNRQTALPYEKRYRGTQARPYPSNAILGDGQSNFKETHAVLDFQAGKDVGLGLFGASGKSVISAGVRFAQFTSALNAEFHARPRYTLGAAYSGHRTIYRSLPSPHYQVIGYRTINTFRHTYAATLQAKRNSHALGPSVSWSASIPVVGSGSDMNLTVDWGVAGAVLFGRQRTYIHHQTSGQYNAEVGKEFKYPANRHDVHSSYAHGPYDHDRTRSVTIPNIGGFAGTSLQFRNAKISLGYRADFFFGALDGGIDTAKKENVGFYGPFASISIGLGG